MTIIEVVTTVVVMGLVIAPLSMTLMQAITLVPRASESHTSSVKTDYLLSTLSHDISNSTIGLNNVTAPNWNTVTLVHPPSNAWNSAGVVLCPATATTTVFAQWWWNDTGVTPLKTYSAQWQMVYAPAPKNGLILGQLQRRLSVASVWGPWETYSSTYCLPNAGWGSIHVLLNTGRTANTITTTLQIIPRDSSGAGLPWTVLQSSMRVYD